MIGNIENKQVFGRWLRRHWVPAADGELEVEIRPAKTQHGSIEATVALKAGKLFQIQTLLVLRHSTSKVAYRAGDSQMKAHSA